MLDPRDNHHDSLQEPWSQDNTQALASTMNIAWTNELQAWVNATRAFYTEFDHSPNTRVLIKYLKTHVSADITSMTLQIHLSGNPALILAQLAGIPKPKQCF